MTTNERMRFPLLASADYDPNTFDYASTRDGLPGLRDWIGIFRASVSGFQQMAEKDEAVPEEGRAAKAKGFADSCALLSCRMLCRPDS
jgi:hypothetical protein